jgi:hypothetical protein
MNRELHFISTERVKRPLLSVFTACFVLRITQFKALDTEQHTQYEIRHSHPFKPDVAIPSINVFCVKK